MSVFFRIACRTCVVAMTVCVFPSGCSAPTPSDRLPTQSPAAGPSFVDKVWSVHSEFESRIQVSRWS